MQSKVLFRSLIINIILTSFKFIGGIISNSKTLLSDAVHSLSDTSTDFIGIIGSKLSNKKPDLNHPYGHGRVEYLTSIAMSIFIISLGLGIIISSFGSKNKVTNIFGLIILILTIVFKYLLSKYLLRKGRELKSNIILTNAYESKVDMYNSLIAFIFVLLSLIGKSKAFIYADMIGSILIALFIIKIGISIFIENIKSILGERELDENIINKVKDIVNENNVKIRRNTLLKYGYYYEATIDLLYNEDALLKDVYKIEKKIKNNLKKSDLCIRYVTVNFKPKKVKEHTKL